MCPMGRPLWAAVGGAAEGKARETAVALTYSPDAGTAWNGCCCCCCCVAVVDVIAATRQLAGCIPSKGRGESERQPRQFSMQIKNGLCAGICASAETSADNINSLQTMYSINICVYVCIYRYPSEPNLSADCLWLCICRCLYLFLYPLNAFVHISKSWHIYISASILFFMYLFLAWFLGCCLARSRIQLYFDFVFAVCTEQTVFWMEALKSGRNVWFASAKVQLRLTQWRLDV